MKAFLVTLLIFSQMAFSKEFVCHKLDDVSQAKYLYGFIENELELVDVIWQISKEKIRYIGDLYATKEPATKKPKVKADSTYSYFIRDFETSKVELWFEKSRMINDAETTFSAAIGSKSSKVPLLCEKI